MARLGKPVLSTSYFTCGVLVLLCSQTVQASAEFKFLTSPKMFYAVPFGSNFKVDCTTNDPSAITWLYHRQGKGRPWQQLLPKAGDLVKAEQVYTVLDFGISDAGQYQCRAKNSSNSTIKWSDLAANVIPNPNLTPDVNMYPPHAVVLTAGQSYNITCSSVAHTTLQWFRKTADSETLVPSNKLHKETNTALNKLNLILMFKNAQKSDAGTFKCLMTYQGKINFKYVTLQVYASAEFKFLTSPKMFYAVPFGSNFKVDCTTNDPSAITWLYHRQGKGRPWQQLLPKAGDLVKAEQVYTVLDFGISDAGQYQCRAKNSSNSTIKWSDSAANVIPNPNLTPDVNMYPPHAVVLTAGQSYNITCSSVAHTTLQWFRKTADSETLVPSNKTHKEANTALNKLNLILMFKNAQKSDAGTFKCLMTYQGKENFKYATLQVYDNELPKVKSSSNSSVFVKASNQTTLYCLAYGHPRPTIFWYKDGRPIRVDDTKYLIKTKPITKHTEMNGSLTILKSLFPDDNGTYTCKIVNSQGSDDHDIFVNVQAKPVIVPRKDPFLQTIGKPSEVNCKIAKSNPKATFIWEYQICMGSQMHCQPTGKWLSINSTSTHSVIPAADVPTNFSRVTVSKEQESTFYRCTAKNKHGSDRLVLVFRRIDPGRKLVDIIAKDDPLVFLANQPITIGCVGLSQGAMFDGGIEWFRDNTLLSPKTDPRINITNIPVDRTYTNVTLTIINTTISDSGLYTCDATFLRLQKIYNDTINVIVKARVKPNITGLVSQEVREGISGYVELVCKTTTARPKPIINWYKKKGVDWINLEKEIEGRRLSSTKDCSTRKKGFYIINKDGGHLVICSPKHHEYTGWYRCIAENSEGRDKKEAKLNILAQPIITNLKTREIKVAFGTTVNKTCSATGNPLPEIVWTRTNDPNGEVLKSGKGKALLVVENVKKDDFGNYTCNATNSVDSDDVIFTIKELEEVDALATGKRQMSTEVLIGIVSGCIAFVFIVIVICLILYRRQKKQIDEYKELYFLRTGNSDYKIDPDRSLLEQCNNLPYDLDWEFPEERLILGKPLGAGAFGQVLKAEAIGMPAFKPRDKTPDGLKRRSKLRRSMRESKKKNEYSSLRITKQTVAVKTLKEGANQSDYKDLASELKILIHLGEHKNIVNVLGACTRGRRLMVIIEYAPHGNLLSFLRNKRDIYDPNWVKTSNNPDQEFTLVDLGMAAYQISRGMEFLASRKCVHRDLAARNVLVGKDYVMKISDFGLARDIYQDDLYVKTTSGLLPVKWMALESLFDRVYTEKSDVWAFGIVLWEIFTLGGTPYPGLPTEQLLDYLSEGSRMKQPQDCPLEMYTIMRDCWIENPEQRPNFVTIAERLGKILEKNVTTDNPYIQLEVDDDSGTTNYYLNPCDSNMRGRKTVDGYEEALPTPRPESSQNYNSPLPTLPPDEPESPGYDVPNLPLPSIPPTYEEATQKPRANPEYRNASESSNESGIGIDEKEKGREDEPLLVQLGYDEPAFSGKKGKRTRRDLESSV